MKRSIEGNSILERYNYYVAKSKFYIFPLLFKYKLLVLTFERSNMDRLDKNFLFRFNPLLIMFKKSSFNFTLTINLGEAVLRIKIALENLWCL